MGEARTVLFKRKNELRQKILTLKEQEERILKELISCRNNIVSYTKALQEVNDVYNTLT